MSNQAIYIPEFVEQGVAKLVEAKNILVQIEAAINSGISTINSSGYNRGIPHIEKGTNESSDISSLESTINTITTEIQKYSNGEALELENTIIIADPETIEKYGLKKEDIDYTLSDYILKSDNIASNPTIQGRWESGYLKAPAGYIIYTGADGRLTKETWCNLNPNNLAKLMREDHGIELDFWIREDGVYMYGDYVMVAADIPHMDGTQQEAEYRKGDLVQTSLGTGMVVDYCGMANSTRRGYTDVDVWYDIYTAWGAGGVYGHNAYCTKEGCTNTSHNNPQSKMIREAENPTTINPRTGQPISSGFVFNSNTTNQTTTTTTSQNREVTQTTTPSTTTQSSDTFVSTTPSTTTTPSYTTTKTPTTTTTPSYTTTTGNTGSGSYSGSSGNANSTFTSTPSGSSSNGYYSGGTTGTTTSTPTTSQVTNLYDVNGFSKPAGTTTSTPTTPQTSTPGINTTPVTTPTVSTPTVNTTISSPTTTPEVNNVTTTIPSVSDQIMTPEVGVDSITDAIDTTPTPITPITPEVEDIGDIITSQTPTVEKVPTVTPADTQINETSGGSSSGALVAALATAGAVGAGIGAKIYIDKRKENQNNDEDDDFSEEE